MDACRRILPHRARCQPDKKLGNRRCVPHRFYPARQGEERQPRFYHPQKINTVEHPWIWYLRVFFMCKLIVNVLKKTGKLEILS